MNNAFYKVTDKPFSAAADGVTDDREAIQAAIDAAFDSGGGTVLLDDGKTFLSSGSIIIKTGVELRFGDGCVLQQSNDGSAYVKPAKGGVEPYKIIYGHNYSETIKWSHVWYKNYPFIFAEPGTHDFKITGSGTLIMSQGNDTNALVKTCPVGFYRVSDFVISDITIKNYHGYAMMPFTSCRGLFKDLKISDWSFGNGDGICLMNCRDIRVTGCKMFTGDDAVYIFSSYNDPRASEWWSSAEPQPSEHIEIDNNDLETNHCKAFGMILWGIDCPDQENVEVRDVYVHDNRFKTLGNWNYNPYTTKSAPHPVTGVRFENNIIEGIEENFFETVVTDMHGFRSARQFRNAEFRDGRVFWSFKGYENGAAGVKKHENAEENYGYIRDFEKADAAIYQGLYIEAGRPCYLQACVKTDGAECRLFAKDAETGELISSLAFDNTDWQEYILPVTIAKSGNCNLGIERGEAREGSAQIKFARLLGANPNTGKYDGVIFDRGKIIYTYNTER